MKLLLLCIPLAFANPHTTTTTPKPKGRKACAYLNPYTDAVVFPGSDKACGLGIPDLDKLRNCHCVYFVKDRDRYNCPTSYYVNCVLNRRTKDTVPPTKTGIDNKEIPKTEFARDPQKINLRKKPLTTPLPVPLPPPPCKATLPPLSETCLDQLNGALEAGPVVGMFVPACTDSGDYESLQCHGSTGNCWCVDNVSGKEISGTRVTPGDGKKIPICEVKQPNVVPAIPPMIDESQVPEI